MSNSKETEPDSSAALDYKTTLFLPKTDFPMKAGLPKREPGWLERWQRLGIYQSLRKKSAGREPFVLHDGPPYANGNMHLGHALNKIIKDIVVRSQQMMGHDAAFVHGWDCHGLPIEWKVEEKYRADGRDKDDVPIAEFRKECREFAQHWIDVQRSQMKRLGVTGEIDTPYTTMAYKAEAQIAREFQKFVMNGTLYRGSKPVMWSVVERTALAEAEVEYHDINSPTIHARFSVVSGPSEIQDASVVIWTTTPWTIPGNRAVAYSNAIPYGIYEVTETGEGSLARVGEQLLVADALWADVARDAEITGFNRVGDAPDLSGVVCAHPFRGQGYDFDVPLIAGDHVTDEVGTGFVHTAPGHGADDFEVGMKYGIEVPHTVGGDGVYLDNVPMFGGKTVLIGEGKKSGKFGDANPAVVEELKNAEKLLASGRIEHSYAHSWRSKAPIIFRNTPQWFIAMDKPVKTDLREDTIRTIALEEIDRIRWVPERGHGRIRAMVENRPDWVVSRQRSWGVPLTVFVHRETGEILRDDKVNERIASAFEEEGADAWFISDASRFLGADYESNDYEKVEDILDVWFDSGSTHAFVLEQNEKSNWPASLYSEGSDQHRGWFQSSLLESCGTRGRAPYDAALTHGFILDNKGIKMAKSGTNAVSPDNIINQYGAEIIRLWVGSSDFSSDLKMGPEVVKGLVDAYRKLRNTMRFMLGNLDGWQAEEKLPYAEMSELERVVLHRLSELDELVRKAYCDYDFSRVFHTLSNFATIDLSAFYFDVRKDALYCDRPDSIRRRGCRTVIDQLFHCLTTWLAPIMCFTMEEVWLSRYGDTDDTSIHLEDFPELPREWRDEKLAEKWQKIRTVRRVVTGALEVERREKRIGSSLEAAPDIYVANSDFRDALADLDLAELVITSQASLIEEEGPSDAFRLDDVAGVAVVPKTAQGNKCQRSWRILPEVGTDPNHPDLSLRDADAVEYLKAQGLIG